MAGAESPSLKPLCKHNQSIYTSAHGEIPQAASEQEENEQKLLVSIPSLLLLVGSRQPSKTALIYKPNSPPSVRLRASPKHTAAPAADRATRGGDLRAQKLSGETEPKPLDFREPIRRNAGCLLLNSSAAETASITGSAQGETHLRWARQQEALKATSLTKQRGQRALSHVFSSTR